ncbi:transporter substrate-binding domain-containing protein [Comamonas sp. Y33R10-2]|uniref:transporter substrate-binding domain-containing protein n=1 Tax=Comamonas sp. Y33R10-2 TaxID=2853257 RepID=UPI001C5CA843|nr:transporter substrate-binding domain-containing protein [Comamonas sp. Y33R10-2]QXZ10273.1 transporter substrate-binding domain-containing protein [Comamonas sp. Y33R10-2]
MHKKYFHSLLLVAALAMSGCSQLTPLQSPASGSVTLVASAQEVKAIAPTGVLRVGVYKGSPTSMIPAAAGDEPNGVAYAMGKALASNIGVPFVPVVFDKNADVLAAAKKGDVDFVFTNATTERKAFLDFTPTVLNIEKSILVSPKSMISNLDQLKSISAKVGVSAGSSTGEELKTIYPKAQLLPQPSLAVARQKLTSGELDGFATNKSILFEMKDQTPGTKVLDGSWGLETFAIGLPKGRAAGVPHIERFVNASKSKGDLARWVTQANLRGTQ